MKLLSPLLPKPSDTKSLMLPQDRDSPATRKKQFSIRKATAKTFVPQLGAENQWDAPGDQIDSGLKTSEESIRKLIQDLSNYHLAKIQGILSALPHFFDSMQFIKILYGLVSDTQDMQSTIRFSNLLKQAFLMWPETVSTPTHMQTIVQMLENISEHNPSISTMLKKVLEEQTSAPPSPRSPFDRSIGSDSSDLSPHSIPLITGTKPSLLSFRPIDLAQQLTLMDQQHMAMIPPSEFHHTRWTKASSSPHLTKIATFSNDLVNRFAYEACVLKGQNLFPSLVKLGTKLLQLRNFNSLLIVHLTFELKEVSESKIYRSQPKQVRMKIEKIASLFNPSHNFYEYRNIVNTSQERYIPCREILLQDMLYVSESGPDFIGPSACQINQKKLEGMGQLISCCLTCSTYEFLQNDGITAELNRIYRRDRDSVIDRIELTLDDNLEGELMEEFKKKKRKSQQKSKIERDYLAGVSSTLTLEDAMAKTMAPPGKRIVTSHKSRSSENLFGKSNDPTFSDNSLELELGSRAVLSGLQNRKDLNGMTVSILKKTKSQQGGLSYVVVTELGERFKVKLDNLTQAPGLCPLRSASENSSDSHRVSMFQPSRSNTG